MKSCVFLCFLLNIRSLCVKKELASSPVGLNAKRALLAILTYIICRTMFIFSPNASMIRKNMPTLGSISPFSMRKI